jgi:butyrate kinase
MNHSDFLEKDLPIAIKHYKCCWSCLYKAEIALANDDFELAEARMIDFQRSLKELHRLKAKKEQYDRMKALVKELNNQGVNIEKVARII